VSITPRKVGLQGAYALQALERQRTAGAVANQALQTCPVSGLDPQAGIDREAAAVVGALTDSLFTGVKGPDCVTGEEGLAVGQ
jgi:hypothetical protein